MYYVNCVCVGVCVCVCHTIYLISDPELSRSVLVCLFIIPEIRNECVCVCVYSSVWSRHGSHTSFDHMRIALSGSMAVIFLRQMINQCR